MAVAQCEREHAALDALIARFEVLLQYRDVAHARELRLILAGLIERLRDLMSREERGWEPTHPQYPQARRRLLAEHDDFRQTLDCLQPYRTQARPCQDVAFLSFAQRVLDLYWDHVARERQLWADTAQAVVARASQECAA